MATTIPPNTTSITEIDKKDVEEESRELGLKKNPHFTIFGKDFDIDSMIIGIILVIVWITIWKTTGLWKTLKYDISFIIIFFMFILYTLLNIYTAGVTAGGIVYEMNILTSVEQMISILYGTMVLFALFGKNLPVHENCRPIIMKLIMSIIIVLTVSSMWINVWVTGRAFRAVRKLKQGSYNVSLALFIIIGLILLKGNKCQSIGENIEKITAGDWFVPLQKK
jgi:cation transport ATPase